MKIRNDLVGAIHVDGHILYAGDTVPRGVTVGAHLLGEEKPAVKQSRRRATSRETTNDMDES